jgi:hypothetical protein
MRKDTKPDDTSSWPKCWSPSPQLKAASIKTTEEEEGTQTKIKIYTVQSPPGKKPQPPTTPNPESWKEVSPQTQRNPIMLYDDEYHKPSRKKGQNKTEEPQKYTSRVTSKSNENFSSF